MQKCQRLLYNFAFFKQMAPRGSRNSRVFLVLPAGPEFRRSVDSSITTFAMADGQQKLGISSKKLRNLVQTLIAQMLAHSSSTIDLSGLPESGHLVSMISRGMPFTKQTTSGRRICVPWAERISISPLSSGTHAFVQRTPSSSSPISHRTLSYWHGRHDICNACD